MKKPNKKKERAELTALIRQLNESNEAANKALNAGLTAAESTRHIVSRHCQTETKHDK